MAVLSLMVLFFVPQNAQAATVKRPSQVKNLTVKLTAKTRPNSHGKGLQGFKDFYYTGKYN